MEEALNFLDTRRTQPFFLYLALTIPHDNGEAPLGQRQEVPNAGIYGAENWPSDTKNYAAMITRMDEGIGLIMQGLKKYGIDEHTLVIFTSDNGPMIAEYTDYFDSNGPLRGWKRDLYEGGIRVPMVARWPGKIRPGSTSSHISAFWDFLPTACEVADINSPPTDGISYLPELLGKTQKKHDFLYWEFPGMGYSTAVRKGKWKAVRTNLKSDHNAPLELFDLEVDLGEEHNVADANPVIVKDLSEIMRNSRIISGEFPMPGEKNTE